MATNATRCNRAIFETDFGAASLCFPTIGGFRFLYQYHQRPSDVYLEVGFEGLSHFSYVFKKQFEKNEQGVNAITLDGEFVIIGYPFAFVRHKKNQPIYSQV